jgi:type I restriction enzyme S subunit
LNLELLGKLEFENRKIGEQQKIAAVLSALDTKIELNQRINAELESMAKTVFRYQFVENKEKGNWKIGTLGDVAENIRRSANPSDISPETHYIGLEHMPRKSIALAEYGNASELESNKYTFKTGEFLFGKLRPYFHKVGIAPVDGVCSTDILVISPKSPEWYGFVLGHISSDEIIKYADATSGGTKMPRTNWESLAKFEISMPPVELAKQFTDFFVPIAKQIRTNILESQTLTELRDWLLPMLMNGQVKVN